MADESDREFGFHTRSIHAGSRPDPATGARALPIYQTTSYVFEDPESAAAYFNLQEYGNTYSRIMNPTVAAFEERLANLEGGVGSVAFASGLAAQSAAFFTLLNPGDHVVASAALYGGSITQLKHFFRKLSVQLTFVDPDLLDNWRGALQDNTKLLFAETIGNPRGNVLDIEALATLAHDHYAPLMIDNTFATPYLCRPMEWGGRSRRVLGDQISWWARHKHWWCGSGLRGVRLVEWTFPSHRRPFSRLSQPRVP